MYESSAPRRSAESVPAQTPRPRAGYATDSAALLRCRLDHLLLACHSRLPMKLAVRVQARSSGWSKLSPQTETEPHGGRSTLFRRVEYSPDSARSARVFPEQPT